MDTGTFVAIKQMKRQNLPKDQLASMMGEIDLLKKLHHPNIVKYNGYHETKEFLCIVLEYVHHALLHALARRAVVVRSVRRCEHGRLTA